jgi:hypothetical protein
MCFPSYSGNGNSQYLADVIRGTMTGNLSQESIDGFTNNLPPPMVTQSNNPTALATQASLEPKIESRQQRSKKRGRAGLRINLAKSDSTGLNIPQA